MKPAVVCAGAVLLSWAMAATAAGDSEAGKAKSTPCRTCHGKDGRGTMDQFPNLAGQSAFYLSKQLKDFRKGTRPDEIMSVIAKPLSDQDIEDLAAYYANLKPACECQ